MKFFRLLFAVALAVAGLPAARAAQAIKDLTLAGNTTATGTINLGNATLTLPARVTGLSPLASKAVALVFEGDSLTADHGGVASGAGNDWPEKIVLLYDMWGAAGYYNYAYPGNQMSDVSGRYVSSVQPHKPARTGDRAILSIWCGSNDIVASRTASQIYADLQTYWAQAKADGFVVLAWTVMPRGDVTGGKETQRIALNALIRSDRSLYDFLIQPDLLTLTKPDSVHPNAAGNLLIAAEVNAIVTGRKGGDLYAAFNFSNSGSWGGTLTLTNPGIAASGSGVRFLAQPSAGHIGAPTLNPYLASVVTDTSSQYTGWDFATYGADAQAVRFRMWDDGRLSIGHTVPAGSPPAFFYLNSAVGGAPASSGSTDTAASLRLKGSDNGILDVGIASGGAGTWLQSRDATNLANNYALNLNPNGGPVTMGGNVTIAGALSLTSGIAGNVTVGNVLNAGGTVQGVRLVTTAGNLTITNSSGTDISLNDSSNAGQIIRFVNTGTNGRDWRFGQNFNGGNGEFSLYDATASATAFLASGGALTAATFKFPATTDVTPGTVATGALQTLGGMSVSKGFNVGGNATITGTLSLPGGIAGNVTIAGALTLPTGIAGDVTVGNTLTAGGTVQGVRLVTTAGNLTITNSSGTDISLNDSSNAGQIIRFVNTGTNGRDWRFGQNFNGGNGEFSLYDATSSATAWTVKAGATRMDLGGVLGLKVTTVSGLPSASPAGQMACVSDASATVAAGIGAVVTGGGSNFSPVYSDGTNWRQF